MKPCSPASERNKDPILRVLEKEFASATCVLEIGSGTGQHAAYFGPRLSHLVWQTSDLGENHSAIRAWLDESDAKNVSPPIVLDVRRHPWVLPESLQSPDAVFSANTAHIMSWETVTHMFLGIGRLLAHGGKFCLYGPFNDSGCYSSESNRMFDHSLRARNPEMGIRDTVDLAAEAQKNGLSFLTEYAMPANNRILVYQAAEGVQ